MRIAIVALEGSEEAPIEELLLRAHLASERVAGGASAAAGEPPADIWLLIAARCGPEVQEAVRAIRRARPSGEQAVVVCRETGSAQRRALLMSGVAGIVDRAEIERTLLPTLHAVAAGQLCLPRRSAPEAERPALSRRERQVMGMVVLGFSNGEIAARLYLAESTVKSHVSSAFAKLGVRSRSEAVDLIVGNVDGLARGIMTLGAEPIEAAGG